MFKHSNRAARGIRQRDRRFRNGRADGRGGAVSKLEFEFEFKSHGECGRRLPIQAGDGPLATGEGEQALQI